MARNIALLVGSLRKDSITRKVSNALIELAPKSLAIAHVEIGNLPIYNQDLETDTPREWVAFRERIRPMDGVVFATPEYNRSIPGGLKNAIDVGSRPYGKSAWTAKPCGIISCSPGQYGGFGANHHLRQSCVFLDMPVMPQPETYVAHADKIFGADGKLDDRSRGYLEKFITAFARWVDQLAPAEKKQSAA
ncbi:MAG TPA: NAD(P)H-dependent oxidoreductase [Kofleriaceae bacterium]